MNNDNYNTVNRFDRNLYERAVGIGSFVVDAVQMAALKDPQRVDALAIGAKVEKAVMELIAQSIILGKEEPQRRRERQEQIAREHGFEEPTEEQLEMNRAINFGWDMP